MESAVGGRESPRADVDDAESDQPQNGVTMQIHCETTGLTTITSSQWYRQHLRIPAPTRYKFSILTLGSPL